MFLVSEPNKNKGNEKYMALRNFIIYRNLLLDLRTSQNVNMFQCECATQNHKTLYRTQNRNFINAF